MENNPFTVNGGGIVQVGGEDYPVSFYLSGGFASCKLGFVLAIHCVMLLPPIQLSASTLKVTTLLPVQALLCMKLVSQVIVQTPLKASGTQARADHNRARGARHFLENEMKVQGSMYKQFT